MKHPLDELEPFYISWISQWGYRVRNKPWDGCKTKHQLMTAPLDPRRPSHALGGFVMIAGHSDTAELISSADHLPLGGDYG